MLLLINAIPVCLQNNPERTLHLSAVELQTSAGTNVLFPKGCPLRVLSDDRVLSKKIVAIEPIGPNDSKARGTKWCVVERSTYLVSFLVAASCAAAAAVIEILNKNQRVYRRL